MKHSLTFAAALALCFAAAPAAAQSDVVATVDGTAITAAEVDLAMEAIGPQLGQVPEDRRRETVIDLLVDMQVLANAAEAEGLDETDAFRQRMAFLRMQALRDAYFEARIEGAVDEAAVRARYDAEIATLAPRKEIRIRHILVEDEETAKALIAEIKAGRLFEEVAREHSKDPGTAPKGGDLGFFGEGRMVPEFEKAAFALYPGEITDAPVQTQFGWHILKLEESREAPLPEYEAVKERLREIMVREKFTEALDELRGKASIEQPGAAEAVEQPGADASGEAPGAAR